MTLIELQGRYIRLLWGGDLADIARLLDEYPELVTTPESAAYLMHGSVGKVDAVALLVARGVDVNIPKDPRLPARPISTAAMAGYADTVRWLLAHGSDVNYGWDGDQDYCVSLGVTIMEGQFEIVRLLVEAGGYLNVLDRTNRTPLTWALDYGQHEIAAYLRSKGAVESHEVPGYVPPPPRDPDLAHVEDEFGDIHPLAWFPVVPDEMPVAVHACINGDLPFLFTRGMATEPLTVPPGGEEFQYAELCLPLGPDWGENHPDAWQEPEYVWAVQWLRNLALYPHRHGTWLGGRYCVVSNGDRPDPLSPYTAMTCWLLLAEKGPLTRFTAADGREVVYYTALPIHTAERDYERRHGLPALLERFAEREVPEVLTPDRPSAVP